MRDGIALSLRAERSNLATRVPSSVECRVATRLAMPVVFSSGIMATETHGRTRNQDGVMRGKNNL